MGFAVQLEVHRIDARGGNGRGGCDQEVHLLQDAGVFLLDEPLHLQGPGVVPTQDELAGQGAVDDVGPVLVTVAGQVRFMGDDTVRQAGCSQGPHVLHAGQADFPNLYSQLLQGGNGIANGGLHLGIDLVEEIVGWDARGQAGQVLAHLFQIIGHRYRHGAGVKGVVAGDGLEYKGAVGDGTGHGADMVAVEAGYQQAALAHSSEGLL